MLQNIEKYLKPLTRVTRDHVKGDITVLQTSKDRGTFEKAAELFIEKWNKKLPIFIAYFKKNWIEKDAQWYEGAAVGYPATNNGLEGTNATIKAAHTFRERLPVGQFLNLVLDLVTDWSKQRDPASANCISFAESPDITMKIWTAAYQWASENRKILKQPHCKPGFERFFTSAGWNKPITKQMLACFLTEQGQWDSFARFKKEGHSVWEILVCRDDVKKSSCTCPFFMKNFLCKHSVGMHIRLQLLEVPVEARNIPLGQRRKRGRPQKAKHALLVQ